MSISNPPKDFKVLFLDMNSFFASVEQQVQPSLRGKPIGVAPYTGSSGCIIAASKEAKAMGVKIGRVGEMKRLCPQIEIIESCPALYMACHKEIKKLIESFTPYYMPLSIDEFVLFLTPREQNYASSIELAKKIKEKMKNEVGDYLTCSIGIGPSRFLAKMAGERQKPDGLMVVQLLELKKFYASIKLTDITGINFRLEARLNFFGINSPADLFNCTLSDLTKILNHWGRLWYFRLRGYEVDDFEIRNKTIGHSHVLAPEYRTVEGAKAVIRKLIHKAGFRIRKEGYSASGVSVSIRFMDRSSFHLSKKVDRFSDSKSFMRYVFLLLKECRWQSRPIYAAVSSFNLVKNAGEQITILSDVEKERRISRALDLINDEFGADTAFPASMFKAKHSAPDRISFGNPRYEILHQ